VLGVVGPARLHSALGVIAIRKHKHNMKKLATLLAITLVAASVGCRSNKLASRAVAPDPVASPQISYVFDEGFQPYFGPKYDYVLDDGFRPYFGSNGALALAQALREAHPSYQIQVDFADSAK
jgi:hypothetical protein